MDLGQFLSGNATFFEAWLFHVARHVDSRASVEKLAGTEMEVEVASS